VPFTYQKEPKIIVSRPLLTCEGREEAKRSYHCSSASFLSEFPILQFIIIDIRLYGPTQSAYLQDDLHEDVRWSLHPGQLDLGQALEVSSH
jgi:hypothetical protein